MYSVCLSVLMNVCIFFHKHLGGAAISLTLKKNLHALLSLELTTFREAPSLHDSCILIHILVWEIEIRSSLLWNVEQIKFYFTFSLHLCVQLMCFPFLLCLTAWCSEMKQSHNYQLRAVLPFWLSWADVSLVYVRREQPFQHHIFSTLSISAC